MTDLEAATAAGMPAIGVSWGAHPLDELMAARSPVEPNSGRAMSATEVGFIAVVQKPELIRGVVGIDSHPSLATASDGLDNQ